MGMGAGLMRMSRRWGPRAGQHLLEWTLLFAAVVAAAQLMTFYVRDALAAKVKSTELQLNGAMRDNRP